VDRALAFDKERRWQSAREMFEALREAYEELTHDGRPSRTIDVPLTFETDAAPSLVVEVAFGPDRDEAAARERARTLEVIEGLSGISVVIDSAERIR
jgi:hypothetical protein